MKKLSDKFIYELIIYCLRSRDNFDLVFGELSWEMNYTSSKELKRILVEIRRYRNKKAKVPSLSYLETKFSRDEEILEFLEEIRSIKKIDEESILSSLELYIKQTRFANLYKKLGETYNSGKHEEAYEIFDVANEKIANFAFGRNRVEKVFGGFDSRVTGRIIENSLKGEELERIPFCIDQLNYYTNGSEPGEVYMALGDSGTGKSIFLISNGVEAARRGFNVLHVQAEGTKKQVMNRYDSCWTGLVQNEMRDIQKMDSEKYEAKTKEFDRVIREVSGEIYVEAFETFEERPKVAQIRELIKTFNKKGIAIHLVLIDYLELFDPMRTGWENETMRQGWVARNFKDIAVEFNCVVGTVTQMQRIGQEFKQNPDFVCTRDNIGGAYEKVRPMDLFFTFNQTPDEKTKGQMRFFIDKAREHADKLLFSIYQDLKRARFVNRVKTKAAFFNAGKKVSKK